jgi:hypothetical protein
MLKKILLLSAFCLIFSVSLSFGQEERENSPRPEPRERPIDIPRNDPPPPPPPRNDPPPPPRNDPPPPRNDPPPPRDEPRTPVNPPSNNSGGNDSDSRSRRRDRESDPEIRRPRDDGGGDEEGRRPGKPRRPPEKPPTDNPPENPNPPSNPNPPNNGSKENDDRDRQRRNRNGGWGGYPYPQPVYYPPTSTTPPSFTWRLYFDKDDVFFNVYRTFIDSDQANFLPYFDAVLSANYEPLYYTYGREFYLNEFPFVADDWTIYYEPDLDDVFVNFNKLGQPKYEKMVWFAVGETINKVNKKFKYNGQFVRPLLVETLPQVGADKLYSFNVKDLPKGEYEIRFIARNGTTLRHFIRLK